MNLWDSSFGQTKRDRQIFFIRWSTASTSDDPDFQFAISLDEHIEVIIPVNEEKSARVKYLEKKLVRMQRPDHRTIALNFEKLELIEALFCVCTFEWAARICNPCVPKDKGRRRMSDEDVITKSCRQWKVRRELMWSLSDCWYWGACEYPKRREVFTIRLCLITFNFFLSVQLHCLMCLEGRCIVSDWCVDVYFVRCMWEHVWFVTLKKYDVTQIKIIVKSRVFKCRGALRPLRRITSAKRMKFRLTLRKYMNFVVQDSTCAFLFTDQSGLSKEDSLQHLLHTSAILIVN